MYIWGQYCRTTHIKAPRATTNVEYPPRTTITNGDFKHQRQFTKYTNNNHRRLQILMTSCNPWISRKFGQQRRQTSLWLQWAIFGLPRCSPKDPWTLDIGPVNSPQSHNLPKQCDATLCWCRQVKRQRTCWHLYFYSCKCTGHVPLVPPFAINIYRWIQPPTCTDDGHQ